MNVFEQPSSLLPPTDLVERDRWLKRREDQIALKVRRKLVELIRLSTEKFINSVIATGDMSAFDGIADEWASWIDDVLTDDIAAMYLAGGSVGVITSDLTTRLSDKVLTQWVDIVNRNALDYTANMTNRMRDVGMTAWNDVKDMVADSILKGTSIDDLSAMLEKNLAFSEYRADMIARTETISAYNNGNWEASQALGEFGPTHKYWIATLDARGRPWHQDLHLKVMPIDQPFIVEGDDVEEMMFPHDPSASAYNNVNCRCQFGELWPGDQDPLTGETIPEPEGPLGPVDIPDDFEDF